MASFNLIDEPWIPCIQHDGVAVEVNLREALLRAQEFRELYDPSPLVTVSLHRLLLAILHRAYAGPAGIAEWRLIWQAGRFDAGRVDRYLTTWHHRFELFHADRPFYQVAFIEDLADPGKQAPVAKLAQERAAGNNATLFDHSIDVIVTPVPVPKAARDLIATQAFSIGFGKSQPFYLSDSPLIRGYSVLASGDSLFESLTLNLLPYNRFEPLPWIADDDPPCWEQAAIAHPDRNGTAPLGYADYLTWQSRQVHLIPDEDGTTVSRCQIRQRLKLAGNPLDPFKCYVQDHLGGWRPRSFRPRRALWRDSSLLFEQMGAPRGRNLTRRPDALNWLARINRERQANRIVARSTYPLRAFGLTADDGNAASVVLWRREELPLPLDILDEPQAILAVREAIDLADDVHRVLDQSTRQLARLLLAPSADQEGGGQRDADKAARPLVQHLGVEERFWPRLETPFTRFLTQLPDDRTPDPTSDEEDDRWGMVSLPQWSSAVQAAARQSFDEGTAGLDRSARALKAVAVARQSFERSLARAVRRTKEEEAA